MLCTSPARWLRLVLALSLLAPAAPTAWISDAHAAKKLSVNDVIVLLQVGYTEAQLKAAIRKAKMAGKYQLKPPQVLKLRRAGATIGLIRFMGIAKARAVVKPPVSLAVLQSWLKQRKTTAWIRSQLLARGIIASQFGPFAILTLNRAGLPLSLLQLIVRLKKNGGKPIARRPAPRPRPVAPRPVAPRPVAPRPVTPRPVAPRPVVPRPATPRPVAPVVPRPVVPRPRPRPWPRLLTPTPLSTLTLQALRERQLRIRNRQASRLPRPKSGIFTHPGGHYQIAVPAGWHILEDIHPDSGQYVVYLTPDGVLRPYQLSRGIWLAVDYIPRQERFLRRRALKKLTHSLLRRLQVREPKMKLKEAPKKQAFLGQQAIHAVVEGKAKTSAHTLRQRLLLLRRHGALMTVAVFAGPKQYKAFAAKAASALGKLKLLDPEARQGRGKRLARELSVQKVIQQNMRGVVSISVGVRKKGKMTFRASGSGFVVTSDGYVLTNWHVAVNMRSNKPYPMYVLNFDQTTKRKSVKARYVSSHYQWPSWKKVRLVDPKTGRISVRFQRQHVDIALLKIIKSGSYPKVGLSSIRKAMLGDTVVALGFPLEGTGISDIGNETITATTGRISRLVRMANRKVNEIQHTAKVAGGNSGGPLFDTATGAVIGINTWVGTFDRKKSRPGMGLGYYYALPIDLGWKYFPDFLEYAGQRLRKSQWYDLGLKWLAKGYLQPARRAFLRVLRRDPDFAPAYMMLASLYIQRANRNKDDSYQQLLTKARRWADGGLKRKTHHVGLMRKLAQISMLQNQTQTAAILLQQAIAATPTDWTLYLMRGFLYSSLKQHAKALADAARVIRLAGRGIPTGYIMRGSLLYQARRFFEGQRAFRQALQIDPKSLKAMLGEANGYVVLKQHADALLHFKRIAKKYPYEPDVHKNMVLMLANMPGRANKVRAWGAFQSYMRSCQLRGVQMDAMTLFYGGYLARQVLNKKYKDRVQWGLWGGLLSRHRKSPFTLTAVHFLVRQALAKNRRGLAYALTRLPGLKAPTKAAALRTWTQLRSRLARSGLSTKELLFLIFQTYPRWSPALIWDFFRTTPTVIHKKTALFLLKKGVPGALVMLMWRTSLKRAKAGLRPIASHARTRRRSRRSRRTTQPRQRLSGHQRVIHSMAQRAFQSLLQGDLNTWMSLHHPRIQRSRYQRVFWVFSLSLRKGQFVIYRVRQVRISFVRHPRYGKVARYFFRMKIRNKPIKYYYWQFRRWGQRWIMF